MLCKKWNIPFIIGSLSYDPVSRNIDISLGKGLEFKKEEIATASSGPYKKDNENIISVIVIADYKGSLEAILASLPPRIKVISKKTGDFKALSDADKELIALTIELIDKSNKNVKIYSNDYSIENVCSELKIPFLPLYKEGIESKITWQVYCPQCCTIHDVEDLNLVCEICGSKLRRRPKK